MARQLFLSLSVEAGKEAGSVSRSTQLIREWLARRNIPAPELVLENGSGLSRIERVSAATLSQLLESAWRSSVMPEFISSFAVYGVDGTLRRRNKADSLAGQAHIKGGTLNDVRAIAGYVLDTNGRRWIVTMIVNHPNALLTQSAQDALLGWVYAGADTKITPKLQ
jgi:D-alanyl-D-alanine carboxypeptidase/D-alanyl-D-alanine-endopeptidase (penicillin-binding protein 4)